MPANFSPLKIATRGSPLALWQANHVKEQLLALGHDCRIQVIKTKGDEDQKNPIHEIGGKGVFTKAIENALLLREADIAVHSLKDLPVTLDPRLHLVAHLKRSSYRDCLILSKQGPTLPFKTIILPEDLKSLPPSFSIGTGSLRRASLLAWQDFHHCLPLRGNVDTRLKRLNPDHPGHLSSIILAEAALLRLNLIDEYRIHPLCPEWFTPSPSQGIVVCQARRDDLVTSDILASFNDPSTQFLSDIERGILKGLGGDCRLPIGILAILKNDMLDVAATVLSLKGNFVTIKCTFDPKMKFTEIIDHSLKLLFKQGVEKILVELGIR